MEFVITILIAVLLAFGSWRVSAAILYHDRYSTGKKNLQQIGKWYKAGDLMRWTDGNIYRCVAKNGYIRAWSPADHPDSWELVE